MYTWYFLVLSSGAIVYYTFDLAYRDKDLEERFILCGFLLANLVLTIGLFYLLEKRTWISNIAHYLRTVVEPRLYSENSPARLHGWEMHVSLIKNSTFISVGRIEFWGTFFLMIFLTILGFLFTPLFGKESISIATLPFHYWVYFSLNITMFIAASLYNFLYFLNRKKSLTNIWGEEYYSPHDAETLALLEKKRKENGLSLKEFSGRFMKMRKQTKY